jgi:hypothetical protein
MGYFLGYNTLEFENTVSRPPPDKMDEQDLFQTQVCRPHIRMAVQAKTQVCEQPGFLTFIQPFLL